MEQRGERAGEGDHVIGMNACQEGIAYGETNVSFAKSKNPKNLKIQMF